MGFPPIFIVQTVVGVIGMLGNCLVCVVIWRTPAMHTLTNAFIFNQATVDFLGSVFVLLLSVIPVSPVLPTGASGFLLCHVWIPGYFMWCCYVTSSFSLVALTFERYLAIVYPYKYQKVCHRLGATIVVVLIWAAGVTVAIYATSVYRQKEGQCVLYFDSELRLLGVLVLSIRFIIPVVSMLVAYIHITVELKRSARRLARIMGPNAGGAGTEGQAQESADESLLRARRNTFKTLVIVFVAYVVCWAPNSGLVIASALGIRTAGPVNVVTIAFVGINSAINPVIYAFKYKQFQAGLRKILPCKSPSVAVQI